MLLVYVWIVVIASSCYRAIVAQKRKKKQCTVPGRVICTLSMWPPFFFGLNPTYGVLPYAVIYMYIYHEKSQLNSTHWCGARSRSSQYLYQVLGYFNHYLVTSVAFLVCAWTCSRYSSRNAYKLNSMQLRNFSFVNLVSYFEHNRTPRCS